jgi:adenosyl cobinamide kinase/adenosyl cobinamide phosphate guanylyltransferase
MNIFEEVDDFEEPIKQDNNEETEEQEQEIKVESKTDMPKSLGKSVKENKEKVTTKSTELSLKDYNLHLTGIHILAGVSQSGKSQLLLNILKQFGRKFHSIYIFTGTMDIADDYNNVIDKRVVFPVDDKTSERLELISKDAKRLKQLNKHTLIILDDCISNKFNNQMWDKFASQGRHSNMTIIISIQQPSKLSTTLKNNSISMMITRLSKQALSHFFEYSMGFDSKQEFIDMVSENKKGYIFINDRLDAYNKTPYNFYKYHIPCGKFKIELVPV